MSEATGTKGSMEDAEAEVLQALDRYFEVRRHELKESKKRAGSEFENFEEARRQLVRAEKELEQIQHRTAELKGEALNTVVESSEASELEEGVTELQEMQKELGDLAEAEQSALGRKREAEEELQRMSEQEHIRKHIAEDHGELATFALTVAEEIDAFKGRVDQRFAEGRTSVLEIVV
jgi:hypothetical protein